LKIFFKVSFIFDNIAKILSAKCKIQISFNTKVANWNSVSFKQLSNWCKLTWIALENYFNNWNKKRTNCNITHFKLVSPKVLCRFWRKNKQVTSATIPLIPFGIKNFIEFLKKPLNRLQNVLVSNVTSPKAPKTAFKNYLFRQCMKVCQISAY
jgi:hypothetical protein